MGGTVATPASSITAETGFGDGSAPELRSISVSGFKSIAKIENLDLRPVNVLIGPNGCGKSNFIAVFSLVHAVKDQRLKEYVASAGGADKVLHFGSKATTELRVQIEFGGERILYYNLWLRPVEGDELVELLNVFSPVPIFAGARPTGGTSIKPHEFLDEIAGRWKQWHVYHFHDTGPHSPMKKTAALDDNRRLRSDGTNLAAFLYLLKEKYRLSYDLVRRTIQLVAPFFDDFVLAPRALNPDTIRLEWRHKNSDIYFDVASLSDGTLRFIALATLLLQPTELRPSVIIVDEPELGLHPAAIAVFASLVKQAAHATQVILSTQSSLLLDHFEPEDVLVAERVNGGTTLTRLSSEKLAAWLEDYSLGQLWEKNELGGRPAPE